MRSRSARLAMTALAIGLGFLVVVQLRSQSTAGGLENLSPTDLTTLIANLNTQNQQLGAEKASLEAHLADLRAAGTQHDRLVATIEDELSRVRRWAGLDPVSGRGVRVTVNGPIGATALNDLLDELRAAGAEALAIEGVRVIQSDVVADLPDGLAVEDITLGTRVIIEAIGNPPVLTASLTRTGGIIGRIQATRPDVTIAVEPLDSVTLPATGHPLGPGVGKPQL